MQVNLDAKTVEGFGEEWTRFDQKGAGAAELEEQFGRYFSVFPWDLLPDNAAGFDLGCGSGRWARFAAERCGRLHCIDASDAALAVARENLAEQDNVAFHRASVDSIPLEDGSMDFGYSLGVLHHVPDTKRGIKACVEKLKHGAPFLIYLYYSFDNRPFWFKMLWKISDLLRRIICSLPFRLKTLVTDIVAVLVYFPLAKLAWILEKSGLNVDVLPLSVYRNHSFYTMRTDALDRLGTQLEQRFSRRQIEEMMLESGLGNITFREEAPYWCAVGIKV